MSNEMNNEMNHATTTRDQYALIGAGPSGLAGARNLQRMGIPFQGFEAYSDVGGLWNIDNPRSTVYHSAHLISSKRTTEFAEFPMPDEVADYPSHRELRKYFSDFARHFDLVRHYHFNTRIASVRPLNDSPDTLWRVTTQAGESNDFKGVIIANGTLSEPNMPSFAGQFDGELMHTAGYKHPDQLRGKRVLIIGAGNSGCDIAVDAVHAAKSVDISVRRGYYFVPKYLFGKPADTLGGKRPLPPRIKQKLDSLVLKWFTGDPVRFGFPKPDYKMYESHPIVNSLILYHIGHGDVSVRADVSRFEGKTVHFTDGSARDYDLILCATGYQLDYPFLSKEHLAWKDMAPDFYLNIFHRHYNNLSILGMIEATGIGWQGRYEQAALVASYLHAQATNRALAEQFSRRKRDERPDMSGGYHYLKLGRMAYYVNKDAYRRQLRDNIASLS